MQTYNTNADMMAGDTGTTLTLTIESNGSAFNLTGYSASLQWINASGTLQQKGMTIPTPTNGQCVYTFQNGDTFAVSMAFQVVITDTATGEYLTTTQRVVLSIGAPLMST